MAAQGFIVKILYNQKIATDTNGTNLLAICNLLCHLGTFGDDDDAAL